VVCIRVSNESDDIDRKFFAMKEAASDPFPALVVESTCTVLLSELFALTLSNTSAITVTLPLFKEDPAGSTDEP
jgi:hypothetical protein